MRPCRQYGRRRPEKSRGAFLSSGSFTKRSSIGLGGRGASRDRLNHHMAQFAHDLPRFCHGSMAFPHFGHDLSISLLRDTRTLQARICPTEGSRSGVKARAGGGKTSLGTN